MILKGKYWLNIYNLGMADLSNFDSSIDAPFTSTIYDDGVTHSFASLRISNYASTSAQWYITYYYDSSSGQSPIYEVGAVSTLAPYYRYNYLSRLIDFGSTPVEVSVTSAVEQAFSLLFTPLSDDEFVSEPNLVQVTNKIMDLTVSEALTKFEDLKPRIVSLWNNNTTTNQTVTRSLNNYDMVFIRANAYSTYTPLCYAIPAKLICGITNAFFIQVADNSKYSIFAIDKNQNTTDSDNAFGMYRHEGTGVMKQVYGLKIPEVN